MFTVGQHVVAMCFIKQTGLYHPVQCNSGNNAKHPCRVEIVKIGRKLYHYINTTGKHTSPIGDMFLQPLETARENYRKTLQHYGDDVEKIDRLVASL